MTDNVVLPAMPVLGSVAVIVVKPVAVPAVARPLESIVAIAVFDELQFTDEVSTCVVKSG